MKQESTSIKNAKLTRAEAEGIRKRCEAGTSNVKIEATRYMVGRETIRRILRRETFNSGVGTFEDIATPLGMEPPAWEVAASLKKVQKSLELQDSNKLLDEMMKRKIEAEDERLAKKANLLGEEPPSSERFGNPLDD